MKLVIFACLAAVALAAPQGGKPADIIEVISDVREDSGDGNFRYAFETENGIKQDIKGAPGASGAVVIDGAFSFPLDDGRTASFTFVADENGYQPESDLIPVPPPLPEHVVELLKIVEQLKAQGAKWDDQGTRLN
ncbi:cuticle protein AMP5 [Procambarus clarkii]|uniref:cuticle protein AMP5 n=1 Tax=Procambarus clarkii TaxID=6728 RepID=UPI001E6741DD|nr:cuticle protein AMP5-like [Procambarus clarkii]